MLPPFCATNFHVAKSKSGGNTRTKPSQLATQPCCATSCAKNVFRITWPLKLTDLVFNRFRPQKNILAYHSFVSTQTKF